ncbi:MAG: lactonase family protein [Burkholderiales bacterium]
MRAFKAVIAALSLVSASLVSVESVSAATYVYVSNADDGDIGLYTLESDGTLKPGDKFDAGGKPVMPMSVSPDKKYLFAAVRAKPFTAVSYSIDRKSGKLKEVGRGPLAESFPYIWADKTGKFLLGASYGANLVSVNPIGRDGKVGEPLQVIPTARNAHSIVTDRTNKFVFVPHLGTDQIFQFRFDDKSGKLTANTPPVVQMRSGTGPRHIIISADNKFAYLLSELVATVTTLSLDPKTGQLKETSVASFLAPDSKLVAGAPRGAISGPGTNAPPPRDVSNDIWASDLHLTANGKFLYALERTGNQIGAMSVDAATGKLTYLSTTPTEKQPRGFQIDPSGKYMVVTGEKSETLSIYSIADNGALQLLKQYPTGKGSNWVEIVRFD